MWAVYLPFFIQAALILFDEFYFHQQRGLPLWERIGHPIDTFCIVLCFSFVLLFPFCSENLFIFIILGTISALLITKDEFVHKERCDAKEQWLHALLFINHSLLLLAMGWFWSQGEATRFFLTTQLVFVSSFCLYQLIYWNFMWKERG